jgi:hypothetical protein
MEPARRFRKELSKMKKIISCLFALVLVLTVVAGCAKTPEVTATITDISKYGHLILDITGADLFDRGYKYGDLLEVKVADQTWELPLCSNYSDVDTGMTVLRGDLVKTTTEITDIHFRQLSDKEIARYVASKEPMDKAGSYGIQGGAALFCERMVGDYYNVMGLPVCRLGQVLKEMAPEIFD